MGIRSKAQLHRFKELVKKGEMKQDIFDKMLSETKNLKSLPERLGTPAKKIGQVKIK